MIGLALSTLVLTVVFVGIIIAERRSTRRHKAFLADSADNISNLSQRVHDRYRARYGRNPTMELPVVRPSEHGYAASRK